MYSDAVLTSDTGPGPRCCFGDDVTTALLSFVTELLFLPGDDAGCSTEESSSKTTYSETVLNSVVRSQLLELPMVATWCTSRRRTGSGGDPSVASTLDCNCREALTESTYGDS